MADKKKTKSTTTTSTTTTTKKRAIGFGSLMSLLAFAAVCFGGISLLLIKVLAWIGVSASVCGALQKIANCLGWIVLCVLSFNYIRHRRKIWLWVVWAISLVMIVMFTILI